MYENLHELVKSISINANSRGLDTLTKMENATFEIIEWINFYNNHYRERSGIELIKGAHSAILESIAYVSLGLGRAALTAMRTQIDLLLGFTYFCDHPREWKKVVSTGEGFKLRSDIYKFHSEIDKDLGKRLTIVGQISKPDLDNVYRVLSAYIHGQSPHTMPNINLIKEVKSSDEVIDSIISIQENLTTALSDYLIAIHALEWSDAPEKPFIRFNKLLNDKQRETFYS
jgi:hypothetical protein